jgi:hypothetical protein
MREMNKRIIIKILPLLFYIDTSLHMYILWALHFHDQRFKSEYYKATYAIPSTTKLPQ